MSKNLLVMAGKTEEEAEEIVSQALAFDESLAAYSRTAEERSDATVSYNPQPLAQLDEQVENFDLTALLGDLMKEVPETVIVTDPAYFEALDELVSDETFPQMKSWMLVAMVNAVAPYLSDDFRVQAAAFSLALSAPLSRPARRRPPITWRWACLARLWASITARPISARKRARTCRPWWSR